MAWISWSWARFFLRVNLGEYSAAFLRAILVRFGLRLILLAILLYMALAWCQAQGPAILAGMVAGAILMLVSFTLRVFFPLARK